MSEKELKLSQAAKELMNNPAYKNAFEDVEHCYLDMWKKTDPRDVGAREILYLTHQLIRKVKAHLLKRVNEGDAFIKLVEKDVKKTGKQFKRSVL